MSILPRLRDEARAVRFQIVDASGFDGVIVDGSSLTEWSPSDRVLLKALPNLIMKGRYFDEMMHITGLLDRRIDEEGSRLQSDARKRGVRLRSAMFALGFVYPRDSGPAISEVFRFLHGGLYRMDTDDSLLLLRKYFCSGDLSFGQLYLLLQAARGSDVAPKMAGFLARTIKSQWVRAPYHLALDLLHSACMCGMADDADRADLIETIESLPSDRHLFLSSAIVDALKSLGALDQQASEHYEVAREEVRQCLAKPKVAANYSSLAYRIYTSQFDHPYDVAYCQAVSELSAQDQKRLLMMAAEVAERGTFLTTLLSDLAAHEDPMTCRYLCRFAELPCRETAFPQDEVGPFVVAHVALGRLGCPPPDRQRAPDSACSECLAACGTILYWINRRDLDEGVRREECLPALERLYRHRHDGAVVALHLCDPGYYYCTEKFMTTSVGSHRIADYFPEELAEVCRCALRTGIDLKDYSRYFSRNGILEYAMDFLARYGTGADLTLLRGYVSDLDVGTHAIRAIKAIEQRSGAP